MKRKRFLVTMLSTCCLALALASTPVPAEDWKFTLYGLIGHQWVEGDRSTGNGAGENGNDGFDYTHWQVGLSRPLLGFTLDLSYQDTDEASFLGKDIADERVVFSVSRSF